MEEEKFYLSGSYVYIYIYILLQDNERISNYVWNKEEINGTMMFTLVQLYLLTEVCRS